MRPWKARAPAKLILSGEHAVLYGQPAVAMAVNCYAESIVQFAKTNFFLFQLLNLEYSKVLTLKTLKSIREKLQENYNNFLAGKTSIKEVIEKPFELLQYTVGNLIERLNVNLPHGIELQTYSSIPIGCGMGSSSATIMSTIYAFAKLLNMNLDVNKFITLGKESENLQHGISSGLDVILSLKGGFVSLENGVSKELSIPHFDFFLVLTGKPECSTGECVTAAKEIFEKTRVKEDFGQVTKDITYSLENSNFEDFKGLIKYNHDLLVQIGVVPLKVQSFINKIEQFGFAGKICGAGAVIGQNAGAVLVLGKDKEKLSSVVKEFGYELKQVQPDYQGVKIV